MSYWRRVIKHMGVDLGNEAKRVYGQNQREEYNDCGMCEKSF